MTIVSVRKEPPGLLSEPINKKLTVSCPLLRTWLPEASIVASGAIVFIRMFGSTVGSGVWVGTGGVGVSLTGSGTGVGRKTPVGVQGTGWKGVGVGDAFGTAVTNTNGRAGCAWAGIRGPQPARIILARIVIRTRFLIYSDAGVTGVFDGVKVGGTVGTEVKVDVGGTKVKVGMAVGTSVSVKTTVGKVGIIVTPGAGVRVGTLGTQSSWPA